MASNIVQNRRDTIKNEISDEVFLKTHQVELLQEDDCLENLNEITKRWWVQMREGVNKKKR